MQVGLGERHERPQPDVAVRVGLEIPAARLRPVDSRQPLVDRHLRVDVAEQGALQREAAQVAPGHAELAAGERQRAGGGVGRLQRGHVDFERGAAAAFDAGELLERQRLHVEVGRVQPQ